MEFGVKSKHYEISEGCTWMNCGDFFFCVQNEYFDTLTEEQENDLGKMNLFQWMDGTRALEFIHNTEGPAVYEIKSPQTIEYWLYGVKIYSQNDDKSKLLWELYKDNLDLFSQDLKKEPKNFIMLSAKYLKSLFVGE